MYVLRDYEVMNKVCLSLLKMIFQKKTQNLFWAFTAIRTSRKFYLNLVQQKDSFKVNEEKKLKKKQHPFGPSSFYSLKVKLKRIGVFNWRKGLFDRSRNDRRTYGFPHIITTTIAIVAPCDGKDHSATIATIATIVAIVWKPYTQPSLRSMSSLRLRS